MTAEIVYLLCALLSAGCAVALLRSYVRGRSRLVLWSGIGFIGFALTNAMLFVDLELLPSADLTMARAAIGAAASLVLVVGLVWDLE